MGFEQINITEVPSDLGSVYRGKSRGPGAFTNAGLLRKLAASGMGLRIEATALAAGDFAWASSTREPNGARNEAKCVEACGQVQRVIGQRLASMGPEKTFQLIFSGECLYCPAILSAYWHYLSGTGRRVGIIYVDADCDLYTPVEPNSTGNIAGMTLTHLTLRDGALESMKEFSRPDGSGVVDSNNIVLFGLNIDSPANKREHLGYLFDNNFRVVTSQTVQKAPLEQAREALKWLEDRVDLILVHLDVDVIDPGLFPLGNVPSWTGLGFKETMAAVKVFLNSQKTVGLSVAEVNPDHAPGLTMTGQLLDEIIEGLKERQTSRN
ncbi:Arginase/deacetylase [Rhizodiscina lignyota]|uniref:Arginase/deacetylase n=1 Tax=Rhizodiscina lignyota TaxID=1504668 RepID=A0A9P4IDH6_9PEZI|nr:Arginase/deacetylase [Rhizodiscina lignyota]